MNFYSFHFRFFFFLVFSGDPLVSGAVIPEQCATAMQAVTSCLNYATGKEGTPTKECCTAVGTMKEQQPTCLCLFIAQTHNGSEQMRSLGIQEGRILQLPSACKLTNASTSNCPNLLGISPTSPAAAVFTNTSGTAAPPTSAASSSSSSSSSTNSSADSSIGYKHEVLPLNGLIAITVVVVFLYAFPGGLLM